ncbi:hypothetical protein [Desulfovibrio ferrophilus]|uniref:Uncharacterized protein n=1 Tax=Desulfovibrio ferrophilus TaxID=241368 RepID=A0A2Z6AYX8_9BACT|nr:hypothetical protein [Desulfovibrio ferrophilus]BBD08477.1 uncharacterized protein DFE_1751 [Desulfovibrio ferrophilus]
MSRLFALTVCLLAALLITVAPLAEEQTPEPKAVTMAVEYGLTRAQIASFDTALCARLIRFGKVSLARKQHLEAKRFFWKAILVEPTSKLAWMYYDQAVLFTLADQVERSPGLVGLPGLSDDQEAQPAAPEPEAEEGC